VREYLDPRTMWHVVVKRMINICEGSMNNYAPSGRTNAHLLAS
jgi:hypothetical protein